MPFLRQFQPSVIPRVRNDFRLMCRQGSLQRNSNLVRPDAHELLAEIGALQQTHESAGRAVEAFGDELLVLQFPLAEPLRHVAQEIALPRGKVENDEAAEG